MVGKVITFYSYKGGVGRSMAMANIGVLLAKWGYKTLLIDWDLEAPGLENFYKDYLDLSLTTEKKGLIDLLNLKLNRTEVSQTSINWKDYIIPITIENNTNLDLITAGKKDENYISKVRSFDFSTFYSEHDGGQYLETLRNYWIEKYNFVLIDSRTGLTDSSGICSIQMPDILVLIFTPNEQSFKGVLDVSKKAIEGQKKLIFDRFQLRTFPIPSRIEESETHLKDEWLQKIAENSNSMYEWLPKEMPNSDHQIITPAQLINQVKIPYKTLFAYGERLPVVEKGTDDPQSIGYVYETISAVLANDFQNIVLLKDSRDEYLKKGKGEEVLDRNYYQKKLAEETERLTKQQNELKQQLEEQLKAKEEELKRFQEEQELKRHFEEQELKRLQEERLKAEEKETLNKQLEDQLKVKEQELRKQLEEELRVTKTKAQKTNSILTYSIVATAIIGVLVLLKPFNCSGNNAGSYEQAVKDSIDRDRVQRMADSTTKIARDSIGSYDSSPKMMKDTTVSKY